MTVISFITIITEGRLFLAFVVFLLLFLLGYTFAFKQNWLRSINKVRETFGLRYRLKTSKKTNQVESKVLKIVGIIFILVGLIIFSMTLVNKFV